MKMTTTPSLAPAFPGGHADFTARLAAPRKEIEHEFLQMGEKLIACTRLLNETSEAYAEMAGALAGSDFSELTDSVDRLSGLVARLDRDRIATQAFLKELNDLTVQFPDRIGALTRAVRTLRMFFVTVHSVAATTGHRDANLLQFVEEFQKLGSELEGSVASFADAFARMRDSLHAASEMNAQFGAQLAELLDRIAAERTRNLEAMNRCRLWAESRVSAHAQRSERINARVSRAVSTLQVGDSTRQRVEDVEEALQRLSGVDDPPSVSAVYALTSAQLRGAIADFDSETGALAQSLQELLQDTRAMLDSAAADSDALLSSGDSALGAIDGSLQQIAGMLAQYESCDAALSVAIDQLVAAVGNMLDHVSAFDDIRQTVRLLSINATLRSNALDEDGRAFRQVATDLRSLNDETDAPVEEVMDRLEKCGATLRGFLDARNSGEESRTDAMQDTLETSRQRVGNIATRLRDRASFMADTGPRALAELHDATATVTDRQDFCATWRGIAAELAALAGEQDLRASGGDQRAELLAEIYKIYSMKAERDIHNALLGTAPEEDSPPNGEEEDSLGDIFF
jgi:chromosome segregation ATPase